MKAFRMIAEIWNVLVGNPENEAMADHEEAQRELRDSAIRLDLATSSLTDTTKTIYQSPDENADEALAKLAGLKRRSLHGDR